MQKLLAILFILVSCNQSPPQIVQQEVGNLIQYAQLLSISESEKEYLIQIKTPDQKIIDQFHISKNQSFQKWAVLSSVFAGFLSALECSDYIIAVDNSDYLNDTQLIQKAENGQLPSIVSGNVLNWELLLLNKPEILVHSGFGELKNQDKKRLQKSGIHVLICNNYLETDPLGRAEWIKLFGILSGKKEEAFALFDEVEKNYLALRNATKQTAKPTVMAGAIYSGVWDVPSGQSFMGKLIQDAGGDYVWKHFEGTGKRSLSLEEVIHDAKETDIWIHTGHFESLNELLNSEKRYNHFKAFRQGQVFNNNRWLNAKGGNAFWEKGVVRPDILLQELKQIFDNQSDYGLVFYRKLY